MRSTLIPAASSRALEEHDFTELAHFQEAVGGYVEPISISDSSLTIYVNEDGKSQGMCVNERATMVWWSLVPWARGLDFIVGDAVLVAADDDADCALLDLLLHSDRLHVEVQVAQAVGIWVAGDQVFRDWFEAARFALALEQRFDFVVASRVVAA